MIRKPLLPKRYGGALLSDFFSLYFMKILDKFC